MDPRAPARIVKPNTGQHVDAYIEYCQLVGDTGGPMMGQKQYEQYKLALNSSDRLYTTWYNSDGQACKIIGPTAKCFCDHFYKAHDFVSGKGGKVKCKTGGCKCNDFSYVPIHGSQDFKCSCKHSYQLHDQIFKCKSCQCKSFQSSWSCTCGAKYGDHRTVSEPQKQKELKGETVTSKNGGVVSYSSYLTGSETVGHSIEQSRKQKGIKTQIDQFMISKQASLQGKVSAWQLFNRPPNWAK